ncbi:hypothetical protein NKI95_29830 [Mesorhizobium sp. M0306]|uniref:hypothetical protein n=1 Tax=Mesorhizobium sp. M0306 TaxID=2956932 RepID=UPI00333A168B
MGGNVINFNGIPTALTPFDSNEESLFRARANVAVAFEATLQYPGDWIGGEIDGDGSVNNAIARLELGGSSPANTHRGPVLPAFLPDSGWDVLTIDNIVAVNDALLRTQVRAKTGTSADVDFIIPIAKRTGEWDTVLKGLVVIMYRHRTKLRPEVAAHVLNDLLNTRGSRPANADHVNIGGAAGALASDPWETENHVLMIETSRYLTNQLLALDQWQRGVWKDVDALRKEVDADLPGAIGGSLRAQIIEGLVQQLNYDNETNGMNTWMLHHLQRFLQFDFWEYNARPYQSYSMAALQNLYDYAWDDRVKRAARMVLDYVSGKVAVSSNGLRRVPPFRRLREHVGDTLLYDDESEPQTWRFLALAGVPQGLAEVGFNAAWGGRSDIMLAGLSSYRVPEIVLDILLDKSHNEYYQQFHHGDRLPAPIPAELQAIIDSLGIEFSGIPGGVEIYASSRDFLLTAGGIWLRSGNLDSDELVKYKDNGNALPTTLMPSRAGSDRADFIRIDGANFERDRINTGVLPGFACGLNINIPATFLGRQVPSHPAVYHPPGTQPPIEAPAILRDGPWVFIDCSTGSPNWHNNLNLYIAAHIQDCSTGACFLASGSLHLAKPYINASNFGFFEVISADRMDFNQFIASVKTRNGGRTYVSEGENVYATTDGRVIHFNPNASGDGYQWGILSVNGQAFDSNIHHWPLARGDIMNTEPGTDGHNGYVTVDNPYMKQRLVLDMRDPMIPRRYQFRQDAPRHTATALASRDIYRLDVFWTAADGSVAASYWDAYINRGIWGLAIPLSNPNLVRLNSPIMAVARTSENNDLFWIGGDGQVWSQWHAVGANGNEWNLPFALPGVPAGDVPAPAGKLAVVSRVSDQLDLFWIGADGAVRSHFWSGAFADGAWEKHACFAVTPRNAARADSPIVAVSRINDQIDLFWIGADGAIFTHWWSASNVSGQWDQHGHFMIAPPGSARADSPLTAIAKTSHHLDVFWVAPDGAVRSQWWDDRNSEGRWDQHEAFNVVPPGSVPPGGDLASVSRIPTQVDLFWRNANGAIASAYWSDDTPQPHWIGPFDVTSPTLVHPHSRIFATSREPEQLDLLWTGNDLAMWTQWWNGRDPQGNWLQHASFPITQANAVVTPT